jgi:hypothetical protein
MHAERFSPFTTRTPHPVADLLDCGGHMPTSHPDRGRILTSARPDLIALRYPDAWEGILHSKDGGGLAVDLAPFNQLVLGLKIAAPKAARPGDTIRLHFVQRSVAAKRIVGGIAVEINVVKA